MGPQALLFALRACMEIAPSPEVQASFNRLVQTLRSEGYTEPEIVTRLFQAGTDGLVTETWPTN